MTDAATFLDTLPEALYAEALAHVLHGESDRAMYRLQLADPGGSRLLASEATAVIADRVGVDLRCTRCWRTPASNRDDYPFGALCDECSAKTTTWACPGCEEVTSGAPSCAGDLCFQCDLERRWEQIPQSVRDEAAHLKESRGMIPAIKRIREATGCGLREAAEFVSLLPAGEAR